MGRDRVKWGSGRLGDAQRPPPATKVEGIPGKVQRRAPGSEKLKRESDRMLKLKHKTKQLHKERKITVSMRLEPGVYHALKEIAATKGLHHTAIMRDWLMQCLKKSRRKTRF